MPFITPWRRATIEEHGLGGLDKIQPGDYCYVHYKNMVDKWREKPSWTTVHNIFGQWCNASEQLPEDERIASRLAWEVFFTLHVIPYEQKKREENGDV